MKNLRCYAKISINNLLHNFECIRDSLPVDCNIIPVIKANAYSHGALPIAIALRDKVPTFAVATMDEALNLRENGIKNNILVLGYTAPAFATVLADNRITQAVTDLEYARQLSQGLCGLTLNIHVKLDTGMHRFGFNSAASDVLDEISEVAKLPNLRICGIFSHLAESDVIGSEYTKLQLSRFKNTVSALRERGVPTGIAHIANSAAILSGCDSSVEGARAGIILYGAYPSDEVRKIYLKDHPDMPLRQVMTFCARVGQTLALKAGETIGYGRTHTLERDSVIATVTAGYADGIPRALSNKGRVKINGEIFNIVGNVCMDLLMVDITDAKTAVKAGDEVLFWGEDGISIDEYARLADTISYELYTRVSQRVARIYE